MGLRFTDLESWQQWQDSRRRLHVLKDRLTGRKRHADPAPARKFWLRGSEPKLLLACDSNSPTNHHSLLAPLEEMDSLSAVVAQPRHVQLSLPGTGWMEISDPTPALESVQTVASIGDHLQVGAWAHALARNAGWRQLVVQHGLLTPFSPPPPPGVEWLAWSDEDAAYISNGRPDLSTHVTGSAMLAAAAANPAPHVSRFETPVFLGQLHGAELSRWSMTRSVTEFWRQTGAVYRPHPREEDKLSRAQHALWRKAGMEFDSSAGVEAIARPVVSAFSTGVLEAAARGIPAWVFHRRPPMWLNELWARYSMAKWGSAPTRVTIAPADSVRRVGERFATTAPDQANQKRVVGR